MRISDLALRADVSIPTVKFYLRQGLIPAGTATSATMAEYTSEHVERVRLVRALVDVGGLSLAAVRKVLSILDGETTAGTAEPDGRPTAGAGADGTAADGTAAGSAGADTAAWAIRAAQDALPPQPPNFATTTRANAAVSALGWRVDPDSAALRQLEAALIALDTVGLPPNLSTLLAYADAALRVAQADVKTIPTGSPEQVSRHMVLETVMYEPLLLALHRLAQQHATTAATTE